MEKNWLIRTKNNHILGPVSKAKVRELVENGSIKGDDEICSGNGYWFYVREKDLVAKYLSGDQEQEFNPVSEADTVVAKGETSSPEEASFNDDITKVGGIDLSELREEEGKDSSGSSDGEGKKK